MTRFWKHVSFNKSGYTTRRSRPLLWSGDLGACSATPVTANAWRISGFTLLQSKLDMDNLPPLDVTTLDFAAQPSHLTWCPKGLAVRANCLWRAPTSRIPRVTCFWFCTRLWIKQKTLALYVITLNQPMESMNVHSPNLVGYFHIFS